MKKARKGDGKRSSKTDAYEAQAATFKKITNAIWSRMKSDVSDELERVCELPPFQSIASAVWLEDTFVLPIIVGYCVVLSQRIGIDDADSPMFTFEIERGEGIFGLVYRRAAVISQPDKMEARAMVLAQLVAHATMAVFQDNDAAIVGFLAARRLAGHVDRR